MIDATPVQTVRMPSAGSRTNAPEPRKIADKLVRFNGSNVAGARAVAETDTPKTRKPLAVAHAATGTTGCPHFQTNPICIPLPASPKVSESSEAWQALLFQPGRVYFPSFNAIVPPNSSNDPRDGSLPLDDLPAGGQTIAQVIDCDEVSWGVQTCTNNGAKLQGKTIHVPSTMTVAGNSDHHYGWNDESKRGEYNLWLAKTPGARGGKMHVGGSGFCPWSGNGTGCSGATATGLPISLGTVHAYALKAAEADREHGNLGYAIATTALCADPSWVFPATYSDGSNTNSTGACAGHLGPGQRPPEGVRWFLNKTDAQINATHNAPYVKVLLRTMDRQHYGGIITDTNWAGAPGLTPQFDRGDYSFAAREAGIEPVPFAHVPFTLEGIDLRTDVKFCTNGSCT